MGENGVGSNAAKKLILSFRERVISNDHNRLQAFLVSTGAAPHSALLNLAPSQPFERAGALRIADVPSTIESPLRGDVLEGLVVLPQTGSFNLLVTEGTAGLWDRDGLSGSSNPDPANPDDADYKIVQSAGVNQLGVLVIGANASGVTRVDVVEVQRQELTLETDSRDIFDPSTGLFTASTVDKVRVGELIFRVRAGTPGSGFPGTVEGWMPLAVASVPNAAASNDDVTFWDVRPLVRDRTVGPHRSTTAFSRPHGQHWIHADQNAAGGEIRIGGTAFAELNGYLAGGRLTRGIPGPDEDYFDARSADFLEPGTVFAGGLGELWYVWIVHPFGLPRWVRYTATGLREPDGVRGIPVISKKAPTEVGNHLGPDGDLLLPVATTLDPAGSSPQSDAVCIAVGWTDNTDTQAGFLTDGEWTYHHSDGPIAANAFVFPTGTGSGLDDDWELVPGVNYPLNARALLVHVGFLLTDPGATDQLHIDGSFYVGYASTGEDFEVYASEKSAESNRSMRWTVKIPVIPPGPGAPPGTLFVRGEWNIAGVLDTKLFEFMQIVGWKLAG